MRVRQLDFREPTIAERFRASIAGTLKGRDPVRYACILMGLLLAVEAARLITSLGHLRDLDGRHESIALAVRATKARTAALHELEESFAQALRLRGANARLALDIAFIGNALGANIALTTLRKFDDDRATRIVEIDGRTRNLSDVLRTLRHLSVTGDLELHREDSVDGTISFRLGMSSGGTAR